MFILLYGDDTYRSLQKLNEIKAGFVKKTDPSGINIVTLEGEDFNLEKFNNSAVQSGFLVTKRLIIAKNLLISKLTQELTSQLIELLPRLKKTDNIFVFWEAGEPDKRTALFKLLSADKKYTQAFKPLDNYKLTIWVKKYLNENKGKMNARTLQLLTSSIGNDLWQITNELNKLMAYKNGQEITEDDINNFVTAKINENIFGLTDAIAAGNKKMSLKLLQEQLQIGMNEIYLLTMIIRQFRILARLKPLADQSYPEYQIVKETKLHPFVVKKTLPLVKKFTLNKIKDIYDKLTDLDRKFKSTSLPPQTLIDLFIMEI